MKHFIVSFLFIFSLFNVSLSGQNLFEKATTSNDSINGNTKIHGFVRGVIYTPLKNDYINGAYTQASWKYTIKKNKILIKSDVRLRSGQLFKEKIFKIELRSCYFSYSGEKWLFSLGQQPINWGTGDGFNPTNNLSAIDFFSLSEDPSERTISNLTISGQYNFNPQINIQGVFQPLYQSSVYRYDLLDFDDNTSFNEMENLPLTFSNASYALKLQGHFPSVSLSLSAFRGFDPMPWITIDQLSFDQNLFPLIVNTTTPFRKISLGGDLEWLLGKLILRGEIAYDRITEEWSDGIMPPDNISYVFNIESKIFGINIILQYIGNKVVNFMALEEPIFPETPTHEDLIAFQKEYIKYELNTFNHKMLFVITEWNHAININLGKSFYSNDIRTELTGYYSFNTREYLIAPKISWSVKENLKLTAGYRFYHGDNETLFNMISPYLSNYYIELIAKF